MKLNEVINKYQDIKCATYSDNAKILNYYNNIGMQSNISPVKFVREPDYFKQLKYCGPKYHYFMIENDSGDTDGGFSLILRPGYVNGKVETIGYWSDLRFRRDRRTNFSWRTFGAEISTNGQKIKEFDKCRYYMSSVLDTNLVIKKSLSHTSDNEKEKTKLRPNYLSWYNMASIIARKPLKVFLKKSKIKSDLTINISIATKNDKKELVEFLDNQNKKRPFGFVFNHKYNELDRRLKEWDNFSISSFFIARDKADKIIGCFAIWDPSEGRKVVLNQFPKALYLLAKILKLFGKKIPTKGSPLKILFLTHIEMQHGFSDQQRYDIFNKLLDALYETKIVKNYHFISYTDFFVNNLAKGIKKDYIIQESPNIFLQICSPDNKNDVKSEDMKIAPGHEIALA